MTIYAPPARTAISDTYPNPTDAIAKVGFGALWDYCTSLLGSDGNPYSARTALAVQPRTHAMVTGRYYNPPYNCMPGSGSVTLAANTLYLIPYTQTETRSMAAEAVNVVSTATGSITLGIYQEVTSGTLSLVSTVGTVSVTTTGTKDVTYNTVLNNGTYYLSILSQSTCTLASSTALYNAPTSFIGFPNINASGTYYAGYSKGSVTFGSGLPATTTIASLTQDTYNACIGIYMKA